MKNQLVQIDSLNDLLTLVAHPYLGIHDLYKRIVERVLECSDSQFAVAIINPFDHQGDNATGSDLGCAESLKAIRKAWQKSRGWTDATRTTADLWLAKMTETPGLPIILVRSRRDREGPRECSPLELIASSPGSMWLPVSDGMETFGWIGLGAKDADAFGPDVIKSLKLVISSTLVAVNRLHLREHARKHGVEIDCVGGSHKFLELEKKIRQAARQNHAPVLIQGERGSGKELAAYALHYFSERRDKPFVPVLAPALTETLLVDELFGHERNSFTGANSFRKGKFLAADGGTFFIDEVGDLPLSLQAALLRVLDRGEIQPIGRDCPIRVDVRIVTATNKDLERLVAEGRFRDDLYDRLNVLKIDIPPLRERTEDIPLLASHFLLNQCGEISRRGSLNHSSICHLCDMETKVGCATQEFYEVLKDYAWPGNVRELRNLIIRLTTTAFDEVLHPGHLPVLLFKREGDSGHAAPDDLKLTLDAIVRAHIERILELSEYNQTQAAKTLGIARTTLQAKMKKLGMAGG